MIEGSVWEEREKGSERKWKREDDVKRAQRTRPKQLGQVTPEEL